MLGKNGGVFGRNPVFNRVSAALASVVELIGTTIRGSTIETNVAAAKLSLSGTTIAAAGTDTNVNVTLTPKGTGITTSSKGASFGATNAATASNFNSADVVALSALRNNPSWQDVPIMNARGGDGGGAAVFEVRTNGNVFIKAGATYGNYSDRKLKTNIQPCTGKLASVMQLSVKNFEIVGDESHKKVIGFIAQEFEEVFPSLVSSVRDVEYVPVETQDTDGNTTIRYEEQALDSTTKAIKESALIPILVKALQEATARIEALETKSNS